jgi:hypothetical protein
VADHDDLVFNDIKKNGNGNIDGVSLWTCGGGVCDGENLEFGIGINTVLGMDRAVLLVAGCGRGGVGSGNSL